MLGSDIQVLRNVLISICDQSGLDILTRLDTQAILDGILDEARRVLADVAYEWNGLHSMFRLPQELLAECFSFLPFPCRVSASHVSRVWRTTAINAPALWADLTGMDRGLRLGAPLVQCAFSRAGNLPLRFEYYRELDADLSLVICEAMHRMASLSIGEWKGCYSLLERSAPLLESLRLRYNAYLPEEFLAGSPGKLAVLEATGLSLPPSCPGLSNLATLRTAGCGAETLREIFRLCPRLRSLSVRGVRWNQGEGIGMPPESLAELNLTSTGNRYNVTGVFEDFRQCRNLNQIWLEQVVTDGGFTVGPVLHGAVELGVVCQPKKDVITLAARFADGRRLTLVLYSMQRYMFPEFAHIFVHNSGFEQLRTLRIPLNALPAFAHYAHPLPDAEVCVDITDGLDFTAPRTYAWEYLRPLAILGPRKVVIVVAPHSAGDGSGENDARALVAELANAAKTVDIIVRGFTWDAIPEDIVASSNITFER